MSTLPELDLSWSLQHHTHHLSSIIVGYENLAGIQAEISPA